MPGCPNDEIMAAFTEGRLAEKEATLVHEHIDGCQSCQWLLRELAASTSPEKPQAAAPVPVVFAPGVVLAGRYRLERMLGNGGMGTVWAAVHVGTNRPTALKMLRQDKGGTPAVRLRFLREARLLGRIDHPNLVPVRDVFEEGGVPILAMDLLVGESLGDRLRKGGKMALPELARRMLGALAAVEFAHAAGIVHRDLKPDNLFLVKSSEELRVLDFGIAKLIEKEDSSLSTLTAAGEVLGTPPYMAPEQLRGQAIDRRVDVWAFGVILYECLSGRRPFSGERFGQLFEKVTTGTREPLSGLPRDVIALIDKMLTVDVRQRCPDLKEAQAVLQRHVHEAPPSPPRRWWIPVAVLAAMGAGAWGLQTRPPPPSPQVAVEVTPEVSPSPIAAASPSPEPVSICGAAPRICEVPALAMREAAWRVANELAGEKPQEGLMRDLAACADDACLLKRLQASTKRISVVDCAHAVSLDAKAICRSTRLASLAGSLAAHYQIDREHYAKDHLRLQRLPGGRYGIGKKTVPSPTAFSADQTAWLIARHGCGEDEACLTRIFEERISSLREIHDSFTGD